MKYNNSPIKPPIFAMPPITGSNSTILLISNEIKGLFVFADVKIITAAKESAPKKLIKVNAR